METYTVAVFKTVIYESEITLEAPNAWEATQRALAHTDSLTFTECDREYDAEVAEIE
jgi:hypothetical protein